MASTLSRQKWQYTVKEIGIVQCQNIDKLITPLNVVHQGHSRHTKIETHKEGVYGVFQASTMSHVTL